MSRANGRERAEEAHPEIANAPGFTVETEIAVQRGAVTGIAGSLRPSPVFRYSLQTFG